MEVVYKREQGHNYILFPGNGDAGVQTEMIRRNRIPGLADYYTEWEDNQRYYGYDITRAKRLGQLLDVRPFTRKEAESLIAELAGVLRSLESFLLDRDKLVLKPELLYVYVDRQGHISSDGRGFLFFFCEEQEGSSREHLQELMIYLFEKADEEDKGLAELLFRLYRLAGREELGAEELLACLGTLSPEREIPEKLSGRVAEEHIKDLYGSGKQKDFEKESDNRKGRGRKGIFAGKKEALTKLFGKSPMAVEDMWDDLEPSRVQERRREVAVPGTEEKAPGPQETQDHPTEVLYIEEPEPVPCLIEQERKVKILLEHFPFYIGTQPGMDHCPGFQGISRIHLKLERRENGIWITDLNSTNGTALNGEPLKPNEERRLRDGDRIWLAGLVYEFDSGAESW